MDFLYGFGWIIIPVLENEVPVKFLGRALVRGYRFCLDVTQIDWRQYTPVSSLQKRKRA